MADLASRVANMVLAEFGSVNAAAKAIGVPQSTLDRIVRGEQDRPRVDTLQRIAAFYETTVDWLLTGNGVSPERGRDRYAEAKEWQEIVNQVAPLPQEEELNALLSQLPRSLESSCGVVGNTIKLHEPAGREILAAVRAERAAWVRLFRAWIGRVGVEQVRRKVKKNRKEFARRFSPPT